MSSPISNVRPKPDKVLTLIADYATKYAVKSSEAYDTARYCLMDTLGCGLEALEYPACTKLLGPIDPETVTPNGAKVPGTKFQLDPVQAAWNIGHDDPLARLQRHLACREWGHLRTIWAAFSRRQTGSRAIRKAAAGARCADGDDSRTTRSRAWLALENRL
jgi:2-methylcitrate dehydratase